MMLAASRPGACGRMTGIFEVPKAGLSLKQVGAWQIRTLRDARAGQFFLTESGQAGDVR